MNDAEYINLEDVRRDPKLLDKFIQQQPKRVDRKRFEALLAEVVKGQTRTVEKK